MTKDDVARPDTGTRPDRKRLSEGTRRLLVVLLIGPLLLLAAGMLTGYAGASLSHGMPTGTDLLISGSIGLAIAALAFAAWWLWPREPGEVVAQSTRKSARLLMICVVLGCVLGIAFAAVEGASFERLFSNDPITVATAIIGIAFWIVVVPLLTLAWWRSIDEHEATAYTFGALVSAHVYIIAVPAWWLAARAGLLPEQDPMIVLGAVALVWTALWLYRRYS